MAKIKAKSTLISAIFLATLILASIQTSTINAQSSQTQEEGVANTNATGPQLVNSSQQQQSTNNETLVAPQPGSDVIYQMPGPSPMLTPNASSMTGLPIPEGARMFSEDKANIMRVTNEPLVIEMVQTPKALVSGEESTFVMNLFNSNGTWLWHSDFAVDVIDNKTGEKLTSMPNVHGHGSMAQFSYVFPSAGTYNVDVTFGQQVNSPNYIKPHDVRKATFVVDVEGAKPTTSATATATAGTTDSNTQAPIKDIPVNVSSWGFSPKEIEVNKGDLVRLHFTTANDEVSLYNGHGFGIDSYNVNVFLIKGTDQTAEFIADKPGAFPFRCTSFCALPDAPASDHFGMTGTLVVNE